MAVIENEKHLNAIYDLVFTQVHSQGFRVSEIGDLIFDKNYTFLEAPVMGWLESLKAYLYLRNLDWDIQHLDKFTF